MNGWRNAVARARACMFVIACALLPVAGGAYVWSCSSFLRHGAFS